MARSDAPANALSPAFTPTTRSAFAQAHGNAGALTQLSAIDKRADRVKARARAHFTKYEETWVVKEGLSIWKKRAGLSEAMPALSPLAKEYTAQGVMNEARRNVRARMTQRLTNINGIKTRMSNTVIRNLQSLSPSQSHGQQHSGASPKKGSPSK